MNKSTSALFAKRRLTPQEEETIEMRRVNEYDYDKMLEELRFNDSLNKIKSNRIHKVKTANAVYKKNVHLMKTKVEEAEQQRIKEIQNELKEKNRVEEANRYEKLKKKEEDILKLKNNRLSLEISAKRNVQLLSETIEEKRLQEERRTMKRIKLFNEKCNEIHQEKRVVFSRKLQENEEKYQRHSQLYLLNENTTRRLKEEEQMKRFTDIFWSRREREKAFKQKKQLSQGKLDKVQEVKEQKELELKRKKARIMRKIEDMVNKKKIIENDRNKRLQRTVFDDQDRKANVMTNREVMRRELSDFRENILLYQREVIGRSALKEEAYSLKRSVAHEDTIVNRLVKEKSAPMFAIEINHLKSESVCKKNNEEKMKLYRNLLRFEEEKKRKEAEDKLKR